MTIRVCRFLSLPVAAMGFIFLDLLFAQSASSAEQTAYVGSQACSSCHTAETTAWADSHHSWALRTPSPENILGDFNDATFVHKGRTSRFFRKEGGYFVETDGEDGKAATFEIKYAVGISPLQQYLVELDRGRLQTLDIAWDVNGKHWFHLYPDESISAGNGLHWTGPYKNWQARCAVCHQTDFRKNYDPKTRTYQSRWSELSIGCESCHGPGEAHVAWANKPSSFDPNAVSNIDAKGLTVPRAPSKQAAEDNMCGPCHSRREPLGADSTPPGSHFGNHFNLAHLRDGLYFADGQQHDEVYILGSFLQSKMHENGVACTNCHEPHSAKLVAEGNTLCTQCHNEVGRTDFPTLKKGVFDSPVHHHHEPGTAGAQCVSCHMPERNYMVIDARRDHFFRVPDPLLSEKAGSPDVCRGCHTNESAEWAASKIAQWFPAHSEPVAAYPEAVSEFRRNGMNRQTLGKLAAVARDTAQSAIVRASALREMADHDDALADLALPDLLGDQNDLVRSAAIRLLRQVPATEKVALLLPLLSDSVASVRIAAALELANLAPDAVPAAERQALQAALAELRASLEARADFPETQMVIGGLAMTTRNWRAAEEAFSQAVLMDPQLAEAWLVRARIRAALGDPAEAIHILTVAREKNPANLEITVELAGLLINQGRDEDATPLLRELVAAEPARSDFRMALAAALLREGKLTDAGIEIDALLVVSPHDPNALILRALQQYQGGDLVAARKTVREISERYPGARLPPQLEALRALP